MAEFLAKSAGMWLSHRSVHHFEESDDESGCSNLVIVPFGADDPAVERVSEQFNISGGGAVGGARFYWQSNTMKMDIVNDNAAVLVDIPDPKDVTRGVMYRDIGYLEGLAVASRYDISEAGVMTLHTEYDRNSGVERCWFLSDDTRVRVGSSQVMGGVNLVSYSTETRCHEMQDFHALRRDAELRREALMNLDLDAVDLDGARR
ncbi:phycobiliprotein lyase [Synechococcus sp. CS-602]|uniref:phycobiliprotein lyase n=2 Tax=unclassified Synechococcus TaxID=2626047 RepID=UPI0008FF2A02|nr:phycobiliprotein lyase [Synechococcus sp. SynAce01]MCT0205689.1 phycobiliprotein lyase [Synechococcus sp. CS-602]MCT4365894.1 phycobiliprotein lyase [Candidatus Regnicoccus frigidus MAG-AL1]MCT4367234.1 phycobiliprotein lyase [Candidatus Regnicoccus frigidus MAG-AL2]